MIVSSSFTTQGLSWPAGRSSPVEEMAIDGMPAEMSVDATCSRSLAIQDSYEPVTRLVIARGLEGCGSMVLDGLRATAMANSSSRPNVRLVF